MDNGPIKRNVGFMNASATAKTQKKIQTVKPVLPLHYEFLIGFALDIIDNSKKRSASDKGALFVLAQACNEGGWGEKAIEFRDFSLFGMTTLGTDYIRTTNKGKNRIKDYSKTGGLQAALDDYFNKIDSHKWSGSALIKMTEFNYEDIDKAFNTGANYPTEKERHNGAYAYNDDFDELDKKNHYGENLYRQMRSSKKWSLVSFDYRIKEIAAGSAQVTIGNSNELEQDRLTRIKTVIQGVVL